MQTERLQVKDNFTAKTKDFKDYCVEVIYFGFNYPYWSNRK